MDNAAKVFTPAPFVYTGRRYSNGRLYLSIMLLDAGMQTAQYEVNKSSRPLTKLPVGAVCVGAEFSDTSARGLGVAKYDKMFDCNQAQRAEWQALDQHAMVNMKTALLVSDLRATNDIDDMLLPLRGRYHAALLRGDYATVEALKNAVMRSLNKAPK